MVAVRQQSAGGKSGKLPAWYNCFRGADNDCPFCSDGVVAVKDTRRPAQPVATSCHLPPLKCSMATDVRFLCHHVGCILQVLCISAIPALLTIGYGALAGCLDLPLGSLPGVETWRADLLTLLQGAVLGWYACCCGDAWSRELGELSSDMPRLLTTLQPVRRGTHGAVTLLGVSGAAAGGLLVGLLFYCAAVLSPTLWVFDVRVRCSRTAVWVGAWPVQRYRAATMGRVASYHLLKVDAGTLVSPTACESSLLLYKRDWVHM